VGTFYANLTVFGTSRASVAEVCRDRGRDAFVIECGDAVVVLDTSFVEDDGLDIVGRALTRDDGVAALGAVVLDSDVLMLQLFTGGELADTYISSPSDLAAMKGELDDAEDEDDPLPPTGGHAATYVRILGRGDEAALHAALHLPQAEDPADGDDWLFAEERHGAVIEALDLPDPCGLSWEDVAEELPSDIDEAAVTTVGAVTVGQPGAGGEAPTWDPPDWLFKPHEPGDPPPPDVLDGGRPVEFQHAAGLTTGQGDDDEPAGWAILSNVRVFDRGFALQLDVGSRTALPPVAADVPILELLRADGGSVITRIDAVDIVEAVHPEGHTVEVRIVWLSPLPPPGSGRVVFWVQRPGLSTGMLMLPVDVLWPEA
jgi:hypothetical protein